MDISGLCLKYGGLLNFQSVYLGRIFKWMQYGQDVLLEQ